jgi:tetratricopeptide (TPR) repeat protein
MAPAPTGGSSSEPGKQKGEREWLGKDHSGWLKTSLFCLLLAVATWTVFWPARRFAFVECDDIDYILENPHVRSGLTWENVRWAMVARYAMNWHPLTWISHMADVQWFGLNPAGPHLENVAWHVVNALLLFAFWKRSTGAFWPAAFVAAVFALHPLRVESVAWVSERKDLLSSFFALLAMLAYVGYAQGGARAVETNGPKPRRWLWVSLLLFALGLLSKPMVVTLPLLLLLLDFWPVRRLRLEPGADWLRTGAGLVREKIPFFILAFLSCLVTLVAQKEGGAVQTLQRFSLSARVENALVSYVRYLGKAFWPHPLCPWYSHPGHWPWWQVLGAAALLLALSFGAWRGRRRRPWLLMGWGWFVIMLVPVIGLVQVCEQAMADRYSYLPLTGIFVALAWSVGGYGSRGGWGLRPVMAAAAGVALAACAWLTRQQLPNWQDTRTLYQQALSIMGNDPIIMRAIASHYYIQGNTARQLGHLDEAEALYRKAIEIRADINLFHNNLGLVLQAKGQLPEAIEEYKTALRLEPGSANAHSNLGVALAALGRLEEATQQLEEAARLEPQNVESQNNLGALCVRQGRLPEAIAHYNEAVRLAPANPVLHNNLGDALIRVGRLDEAAQCYRRALQLDPANSIASQRLLKLQNLAPAQP